MKALALVLPLALIACGPAPQTTAQVQEPVAVAKEPGCDIVISSNRVTEHKVSDIRNLVKEEMAWGAKNECTVEFDIDVDGKTYHLKETETGLEQMASVCYYARQRARRELLLDIGGTFESKSNINCTYRDKT